MHTLSPFSKKLSGYLLVGPIWAVAVLLSEFEADGLPRSIPLALFALGYLVIGVVTFGWGRMRGFPVMTDDGSYSGTNILRCLVMSCIMVIPVSLVAAPFFVVAARLVR